MQSGDIETGASFGLWDEPGGSPLTGQVVSGMEATRAWSAAFAWNVGRHAPTRRLACLGGPAARGSVPSGGNRKGLSTVAGHAGGPARSSDEAPVMGVERRSRIIRGLFVRSTGGFREELGGRAEVVRKAV
jgi:hypothetical protein